MERINSQMLAAPVNTAVPFAAVAVDTSVCALEAAH